MPYEWWSSKYCCCKTQGFAVEGDVGISVLLNTRYSSSSSTYSKYIFLFLCAVLVWSGALTCAAFLPGLRAPQYHCSRRYAHGYRLPSRLGVFPLLSFSLSFPLSLRITLSVLQGEAPKACLWWCDFVNDACRPPARACSDDVLPVSFLFSERGRMSATHTPECSK